MEYRCVEWLRLFPYQWSRLSSFPTGNNDNMRGWKNSLKRWARMRERQGIIFFHLSTNTGGNGGHRKGERVIWKKAKWWSCWEAKRQRAKPFVKMLHTTKWEEKKLKGKKKETNGVIRKWFDLHLNSERTPTKSVTWEFTCCRYYTVNSFHGEGLLSSQVCVTEPSWI